MTGHRAWRGAALALVSATSVRSYRGVAWQQNFLAGGSRKRPSAWFVSRRARGEIQSNQLWTEHRDGHARGSRLFNLMFRPSSAREKTCQILRHTLERLPSRCWACRGAVSLRGVRTKHHVLLTNHFSLRRDSSFMNASVSWIISPAFKSIAKCPASRI